MAAYGQEKHLHQPVILLGSSETLEGDLVVRKGQEFVIRNKTFQINGNLIVERGSRLIIENSTLIIVHRYKGEHRIDVNGGSVKIINSEVKGTEEVMVEEYGELIGPELMFRLFEGTDFSARNSKLYCRVSLEMPSKAIIGLSTVSYVYWVPSSDLEISDSLLGSFVFDLRDTRPEKLAFDGLKTDKKIDFSFTTNDGGSLKITNSNVKHMWQFNMEWSCKKSITVKNSQIQHFWIKFPPTEEGITIFDLPKGYLKNFTLSEHVKGIELPYDVKLIDSTLEGFKPEMLGTKAEIINSYAMVHSYDTADLIIKNSTIISFFNYGSKRIEFIDTELKGTIQLLDKPEFKNGFKVDGKIIGPGGKFHLIFKNSKIDAPDIIVACDSGEIEGEVNIISPKNMDDVHWLKGIVKRTYPVIVKPAEKMTVKLLDGDVTKWAGITDENGKTSFSITFTPNNYTKELILKSEGRNIEKKVGFLTSTPIILSWGFVTVAEAFEKQIPGGYITLIGIIVTVVATGAVLLKRRYFLKSR
jgi:hypothetical protein